MTHFPKSKKMKHIKNIGLKIAATLGGVLLLGSCASENPFDDGEGTLQLKMVVNSNITRALNNEDELRSNCVLYISDSKGLLHKYKGLENVPEQIKLRAGEYVAEAWTGDSVGASYDKKFFRGYQPFTIKQNDLNQVVVNCKIANVVASINYDTVDPEEMKDWTVTFSHSRASIDIDEEHISDKAYMMMPSTDKDLHYTVAGKRANGETFSKEGVIENVQRAHEYVLNFSFTPDQSEMGGAFIKIIIDDQRVEEVSDVPMYSQPAISCERFDIDNEQLYAEPGEFDQEAVVKISAFGGLKELILANPDWQQLGWPDNDLNLIHLGTTVAEQLNNCGISWDSTHNPERNLTTAFVHFSDAFLNSLPKRSTEYVFSITAKDFYNKTHTGYFRVAVGDEAYVAKAPVEIIPIDNDKEPMAIQSHSATLKVSVSDEQRNPAIEYREAGTEAWKRAEVTLARAGVTATATIKGLKANTRYEYRAVADDYTGESIFFTTEGEFQIPNAGMEDWSDWSGNSKVLIPGAGGERNFWDTGNHGSSTMSVTLTDANTNVFHSGAKAANLLSRFVGLGAIGKFAAGNLFVGEYLETQGTDGRLQFGQPYDGSHPSKLQVWVNYRPKSVVSGKNKGSGSHLAVDDLDQGQIYIALTTEPVEIRTKSSNQKLFSVDDPCVVAYGEKTFTADFGADNTLENVEIPFQYNDRALTKKPLYLVIVCTASKFGDFFEGGEGSVMIVDDFKLLYE